MNEINRLGANAKTAAKVLSIAPAADKNAALFAIADLLVSRADDILLVNADDCAKAKGTVSDVMLDRLLLTKARITAMADGVRKVADLDDPVGEMVFMTTRPNGLRVGARRVPMGVIGMIFESRPNVTVDAAALCLKAGSAAILRGGKEAFGSSNMLTNIMREAISPYLPADCIQLVQDTSRRSSIDMMQAVGQIDLLIPRGGAGLIKAVTENALVPVIETGTGNCHVYVEKTADLKMGADIIYNAKTARPSVCNAAETLLVDRAIAAQFLPLAKARLDEKKVKLFGCPETIALLGDTVFPATDEEYATEFLDYTLAVRVVAGLEEALDHIGRFSTGHSEAIVTSDYFCAEAFLNRVDSAAVYVNASTRFTDGSQFGMGAEIGISTQKLHARGPMGLREMTTIKYIVYGTGQIR